MIVMAPARRMSSPVITNTEAAAVARGSARRDTEVTRMLESSSSERSTSELATCVFEAAALHASNASPYETSLCVILLLPDNWR